MYKYCAYKNSKVHITKFSLNIISNKNAYNNYIVKNYIYKLEDSDLY